MSLYQVGETYYASITLPGRGRARRTLATTDALVAQQRHDELKAQLWTKQAASNERTFGHVLAAWLKIKQRGSTDIYNGRYLIEAIGSGTPLSQVTPALFTNAFGHKSPAMYNRLQSVVRAALNVAHSMEWIDRVPAFKKRAEPPPADRHLTGEEWIAIRAELPEHLQAMADFAVATGLRWSNVANLQWRQVNLNAGTIAIQAGEMKARKALAVPLSKAARGVLTAQAGKHPAIVFPYAGRAIKSPKTAFLKARERAGLPHVRWHDLRHTWASWHAMSGTPEQVLQQLGGWKTDMHKRYSHLSPQYLSSFADNAKADTPGIQKIA